MKVTRSERGFQFLREIWQTPLLRRIAELEDRLKGSEATVERLEVEMMRRCSKCGTKTPPDRRDYLCSKCHIEYDLKLRDEADDD